MVHSVKVEPSKVEVQVSVGDNVENDGFDDEMVTVSVSVVV